MPTKAARLLLDEFTAPVPRAPKPPRARGDVQRQAHISRVEIKIHNGLSNSTSGGREQHGYRSTVSHTPKPHGIITHMC
jgi:hypothetical protein